MVHLLESLTASEPSVPPEPSKLPEPYESPEPEPSVPPKSSESPEPYESPEPSESPELSASPEPSKKIDCYTVKPFPFLETSPCWLTSLMNEKLCSKMKQDLRFSTCKEV